MASDDTSPYTQQRLPTHLGLFRAGPGPSQSISHLVQQLKNGLGRHQPAKPAGSAALSSNVVVSCSITVLSHVASPQSKFTHGSGC